MKNIRWFMEVAYDGTDYLGWQIQPDGLTVQEVLEEKLGMIYANQLIRTESSGRTDAGVHALGQAVTFSAPCRPIVQDWKLYKALNRMLPQSIRIREAREVEEKFHARFSAAGKAYTYVINRGLPNPFSDRWSWNMGDFTDLCELRKSCDRLVGVHDFSSFTVDRKEIDDAVRTIFRIEIHEFGDLVCLTFVGDGFLYKMIRSLMGTLAFAGTGKIKADEVEEILQSRKRAAAHDTAPAQGLFLMKVFYDEESMKKFKLEKPPFWN
ncbi:MAG: tRNA pseudouridine(38-40) synthase TruA [Lentisphaerae bacterium GWF2_50_93]|nr:MAG: tRNA pseudouridine(38-40) synthase TruA [Lentisphaerae bacterium GWF2_50_93]